LADAAQADEGAGLAEAVADVLADGQGLFQQAGCGRVVPDLVADEAQ
jgi:hypothetical protein